MFQSWKKLVFRPAGHMPALDGLRAFSIFWVLALHLVFFAGFFLPKAAYERLIHLPYMRFVMHGTFGVDLFFVLSGFLISGILFRELEKNGTINFKKFYVNRALRLFPAYFFILAILSLAPAPDPKVLFDVPCQNIWANFLYINNYLPFGETCMGWSWSLAIEEQFYIVFPLLMLLMFKLPKYRLRILFALLACAFLISLYVFNNNAHLYPYVKHPQFGLEAFFNNMTTLYAKTHVRFGCLISGVLTSYFYYFHKDKLAQVLRKPQWNNLALGLVILSLYFLFGFDFKYWGASDFFMINFHAAQKNFFGVTVGALILLVFFPAGGGRIVSNLLAAKIWYPFAQLSYAIYLVNPVVIMSVYTLYDDLAQNLGMASLLAASATVIVSAGIYLFIERPFMDRRAALDKLLTPSRPAETANRLSA